MIHSFTFSNVASFEEETTLNLTWTRKDSLDDSVASSMLPGVHVSKVATVIWANSSGKTNLLRALAFLQYWIVDAWHLAPDTLVTDKSIKYRSIPFIFWDSSTQKFSCIFETKRAVYKIELQIEKWLAISETVYEQSKSNERITWKTLFSRDSLGLTEKAFLRENASILFVKSRIKNLESLDIIDFWSKVYTRILPLATLPESSFDMNRPQAITRYARDTETLDFLNELLAKFDNSHVQISAKEVDHPNGTKVVEAQGKVYVKGKEYEAQYYSDGTLRLIDFGYMIHEAIKKWGVLIFDELDSSFHPELVDAIIAFFLSKKHNTHNAQFIFSTHNPRILKYLNRYQINFVEKDEDSVSTLYRLDEVEGVRVEDNYYAKYMAWAYGAKPNMSE